MFHTETSIKEWRPQGRMLVVYLGIAVLVLALGSLGVVQSVRGASHGAVITDEYVTVEPDGNWTGQVAPGEHQRWTFTLPEARDDQLITINNMRPSGSILNLSVDGQ